MRREIPVPCSQIPPLLAFNVFIGVQRSIFLQVFKLQLCTHFSSTFSKVIVLSNHYCPLLSSTIPINPQSGPRVLVQCTTFNNKFAFVTFKDTANDFLRFAAHLTNTLFIARRSPADLTDDATPFSDRLQCDYHY
jgi:hypothetical protein